MKSVAATILLLSLFGCGHTAPSDEVIKQAIAACKESGGSFRYADFALVGVAMGCIKQEQNK